jgi:mRNA-degrading endonuclease toxin of MazEF toxin-antitoxin module
MKTVLIVPFGSSGREGITTLRFEPGETGLPGSSFLKCHFITTLEKSQLIEPLPRLMSKTRMHEVSAAIRRSFDSDAFSSPSKS